MAADVRERPEGRWLLGAGLAAFVALAACGSEETSRAAALPIPADTGAGERDTAETEGDAGEADAGETPSDLDAAPMDTGAERDGEGDDAREPEDPGAAGDPCERDEDCASLFCADLVGGGVDAFCAGRCTNDENCPEGTSCRVLSGTGGEGRACLPLDYCYDADGDGWGVGPGCAGPDCDDANPDVNPGQDELCNGLDDNCNGRIDDNPADVRGSCSTGFPGACSAGDWACEGGARVCVQLAGPTEEVCNERDDDCDGLIDEDASDALTWFADNDRDGWGDASDAVRACSAPPGRVARAGDCDDDDDASFPGANEVCDGRDNDCDTEIDNDVPGVGTTCTTGEPGVCAAGTRVCAEEGVVCLANAAPSDEVCDGADNDCDGIVDEEASDAVVWYRDADRDGWGDDGDTVRACTAPVGYVDRGGDCDDANSRVYPTAPELCDGLDNDCNDLVDDEVATARFWPDADGDGFGDPDAEPRESCAPIEGWVTNDRDCDDTNDAIYPGAEELPGDGVDQNCDGLELCFVDVDGDGYRALGSQRVPSPRLACDGDGEADVTSLPGDCNDNDPDVNPGAVEVCNRIDDNCNGAIDEAGAIGERTWFRDRDNDTWGDDATTIFQCFAPAGWVERGGDCNDESFNANPGITTEVCDGIDNTCDGNVDGLQRICTTTCGSGQEVCTRGIWEGCTARVPTAEVCDLVDNDCDGSIDEGITCRTPIVHRRYFTGSFWPTPAPAPTCPVGTDTGLYVNFYTVSPEEASDRELVSASSYWLYATQVPGTTPFYRCLNPDINRHFYTSDPNCELWGDDGIVEGILGYIGTTQLPGSVPLYRGFQGTASTHLYTTSLLQRDTAVNCQGFLAETIAGYVWTGP